MFAGLQLSQISLLNQKNCVLRLLISHIQYISTIYSDNFTLILSNISISELDFSRFFSFSFRPVLGTHALLPIRAQLQSEKGGND